MARLTSENTKKIIARNPLVRAFAEVVKRSRKRALLPLESVAEQLNISASYLKNLEVGIKAFNVSFAYELVNFWHNSGNEKNKQYSLEGTLNVLGVISIIENPSTSFSVRGTEFESVEDYPKALKVAANKLIALDIEKASMTYVLLRPFLQNQAFTVASMTSHDFPVDKMADHIEDYIINYIDIIKGAFITKELPLDKVGNIEGYTSEYIINQNHKNWLDNVLISKNSNSITDVILIVPNGSQYQYADLTPYFLEMVNNININKITILFTTPIDISKEKEQLTNNIIIEYLNRMVVRLGNTEEHVKQERNKIENKLHIIDEVEFEKITVRALNYAARGVKNDAVWCIKNNNRYYFYRSLQKSSINIDTERGNTVYSLFSDDSLLYAKKIDDNELYYFRDFLLQIMDVKI